MKKSEFCEIYSRNLWPKKFNENSRQYLLSLNIKSTTFFCKNLLNFIKIGEILVKNSKKGEWNQRNSLYFLENLNLDISL